MLLYAINSENTDFFISYPQFNKLICGNVNKISIKQFIKILFF